MPIPWSAVPAAADGNWSVTGTAGASYGETILWADFLTIPPTPPTTVTDPDAWSAALVVPYMNITSGTVYSGVKLRLHRATAAVPFWAAGTQFAILLENDLGPIWVAANVDYGPGGALSVPALIASAAVPTWHALDANNGYWTFPPLTAQHTVTFPTNFWQTAVNNTTHFASGVYTGSATPENTNLVGSVTQTSPSGAFIITTNPAQAPPFFYSGSTPYDVGAE